MDFLRQGMFAVRSYQAVASRKGFGNEALCFSLPSGANQLNYNNLESGTQRGTVGMIKGQKKKVQ